MRRAHEDTIDRTGLDAQSAKQAFSIVNDEFGYLEAFLFRRLLLADFDAIGRTGPGTGFASDTGCQIKTMVAAIARGHSDGKFRKFVLLREGPPLGIVGAKPITKAHPKSVRNRRYGNINIAKPIQHGGEFSGKEKRLSLRNVYYKAIGPQTTMGVRVAKLPVLILQCTTLSRNPDNSGSKT